jgi:hypothetical protein
MTLKIEWQAMDPNGDSMVYALYFRAADETEWKLVDDELTQATLPLGVGGIADGRYRFKVVASDAPGNPQGEALTAEAISDEVVIDNTPPRFESLTVKVEGDRARLRAELADDWSLIASVKVDYDNGDAHPLAPTDGVADGRTEAFEGRSEALGGGEHVATVVATDARGNSTVKKLVFTVDK